MKMLHALSIATVLLGLSAQAAAGPPALYSPDGKYLGNLSANQWDRNSTSNPMGRYGSNLSPDSINNNLGRYGSPMSPDSPNNPWARGSNGSGAGTVPSIPALPGEGGRW